ncbi:hypothetical protein PSPO01_10677 [Paraphaeosphaeria sporulosa]
MAGSGGFWVDVDPLVSTMTSTYLSYAEKQVTVQADAGEVSGWYGPGAYLAWLSTLYMLSLSSIWHANYNNSSDAMRRYEREENGAIDGEFLAALTYPTVAILDLLYRFIRCKVNPTLDAAMLLLLTGSFTLCTARGLASPPDLDK